MARMWCPMCGMCWTRSATSRVRCFRNCTVGLANRLLLLGQHVAPLPLLMLVPVPCLPQSARAAALSITSSAHLFQCLPLLCVVPAAERVRNGEWLGATGKPLTDVVSGCRFDWCCCGAHPACVAWELGMAVGQGTCPVGASAFCTWGQCFLHTQSPPMWPIQSTQA